MSIKGSSIHYLNRLADTGDHVKIAISLPLSVAEQKLDFTIQSLETNTVSFTGKFQQKILKIIQGRVKSDPLDHVKFFRGVLIVLSAYCCE